MIPHGFPQLGSGGTPGSVPAYLSFAVSGPSTGGSLTSVTVIATVAGLEFETPSLATNS